MPKTTVILLGFTVLACVAPAKPLPCVSGTLSSYIALGAGGCTVGPVIFANFTYAADATGGAPQISPDEIKVTPSFTIPATGGFIFSSDWGVAAGQTQDSIIKYT